MTIWNSRQHDRGSNQLPRDGSATEDWFPHLF